MGDFTAKALSIFLSLAAILSCSVTIPAFADAHDGLGAGTEDGFDIAMDADEPREAKQGSVVGRVPQSKKPDFLLKNLKPKDYPIEFLIPFIKVNQVFGNRIPAKEQPREQSAMQPKRAIASEEAAAKKARPWAKEFNEKMAPFQASAGSEAWPEDLSEAIGQVRRDAIVPPKPAMIGVRPPAKPAGNLIKSLKAD